MNRADRDALSRDQRLRVTEIFHSIQGEARPAGCPTAFIRLTGCPLRCRYCDTPYAFHGGELLETQAVLKRVADFGARYVCVTGGEPLAQGAPCRRLLTELADAGYAVSLETGGALDIAGVDARVSVVLDLKTPGSGEERRNLWSNLQRLREEDQLKFVLCDRTDYEWARRIIADNELASRVPVLMSPVHGQLDPKALAEWILDDALPVRLQLQMHKYIWGDEPGH